MAKIRLGILGGGGDSLIGPVHRIASSMFDRFEIVGGVFNPNWEENISFAKKIGLKEDRIYKDFEEFLSNERSLPTDQRIEVVSVLTPNFLHFPMAKRLLEEGFHVICEKPLTTTYAEALELKKLREDKQLIFAVTYTYSGYPMVRQMRSMIRDGKIGKIQKIDAQYYQGWINPVIHDPESRKKVWRLQPEKSGQSCCIGDVGTHAFQMLEYVTGRPIRSILADLNYLYEDNIMDIDGTVLLRLDGNAKGVLRASQIATAEENNFTVAIYGTKGHLKWAQENPNYLYYGLENTPLQVLKPGHEFNSDAATQSTKLPPGHPEGIFDAMGNIYHGVADAIANNPREGSYPDLMDGVRGMQFIECVIQSHKSGNQWINIQ
ncbi:MAG: Gfo/Idh/MocA family protein [Flavobacteriaceae bacterium]